MMTTVYSYIAMLEEVTRRLGGKPEGVNCTGKTEVYRRGGKAVTVERELYFDDDDYNKYDIR